MEKRVIITPELLLDQLGDLEPETLMYVLHPFIANGISDALKAFDDVIISLQAGPDQPGRTGAVSAFESLRSAYIKMTIFERESIRKGLPLKLAQHLVSRNEKRT